MWGIERLKIERCKHLTHTQKKIFARITKLMCSTATSDLFFELLNGKKNYVQSIFNFAINLFICIIEYNKTKSFNSSAKHHH